MQQRTTWLRALAKPSAPAGGGSLVPGLIAAVGADRSDLAPEQIAVLERAAAYGADYVFFRAATEAQPAAAEALIFIDDPLSDDAFAELHRRLWSWGGVPLILRKRRARVDLLRCAHRPDFIGEDGRPPLPRLRHPRPAHHPRPRHRRPLVGPGAALQRRPLGRP
jgi:hypothetical protein